MWILPLLLLCLVMTCRNELFRVCDCSPSCVWVQMQQSWKSWKASTWTYTPLSLYLHNLVPEVKQLKCNSITKTLHKLERLLPPSLSCHAHFSYNHVSYHPLPYDCLMPTKLLECNSIAQTWHKELFQALIWIRCTSSLCYEALVLCCSWSQGPISRNGCRRI